MAADGRILHSDWDRYDTRHAVSTPARMTVDRLESGYWRAYRDFYRFRSAATEPSLRRKVRHAAYTSGWKKFEPLWDWAIRSGVVGRGLPVLETVLAGFGAHRSA